MIARPTYSEEFANIRENIHKVIVPNNDGTFSDVSSCSGSFRSKKSKVSKIAKKKKMTAHLAPQDVIVEEAEDKDDRDEE